MKASTPELMKFQRLMRRLKESKRGTIGLLEGMWLAVGKNCPRGDIGKFTNEEIAIMVDWEGDPDELIDALVECGWLDVCKVERLVVHDWNDHCPTYIKGGLTTKGQQIAIATPYSHKLEPPAKGSSLEPVSSYSSLSYSVQATSKDSPEPSRASPLVEEPKGKKKPKPDFSEHPLPKEIDTPQMRDAWRMWCKHRKEIGHALTETQMLAQLKELVKVGEPQAIRGIEYTVSRGWQGLRYPDESEQLPAKPREKTQAEKDAILAEVRARRAKEDGRDGS